MQDRSQDILTENSRIVLGALFVAALLLRLPLLGYSFYGDEWFSLLRDSSKLLTGSEDRFRPLFFSLLYLWRQIGFSGEIGLRLLPLIFGLLQIPVAYLVGKELRNARFGLLFALLVSLSPILIEFSLELRMYSLVGLFALLQVWLFLKLMRGPTPGLWAIFVLVALAGVYTHLFYWLFLIGMALSLWRVRGAVPLRQSLVAVVATILLYLPNVLNLLRFAAVRGGEYPLHLPSALPKLFAAFTVGFNYFALPDQGVSRAIDADVLRGNLLLLLPVAAAAALYLIGFVRSHRSEHRTAVCWLSHELFTIPMLLAAIASVVTGKYFLQPKYLIFCAPFALLILADGASALNRVWMRRALAALGAMIFAIAMLHYWNPADYGRKENWREAAAILADAEKPENVLLTLRAGHALLDYYAPRLKGERIPVDVPLNLESDFRASGPLRESISNAETVYYLYWDTIQNQLDPRNQLVKTLSRLRGKPEVRQLNPRLKIYSWPLARE